MRRHFQEPPHTARAEYTTRTSDETVRTMFLLKLFVTFTSVFHSCSENNNLHVYLPGDIMIGGLFPIHQQTNRMEEPGPISCHEFNIQMLLRTQVMIYAIQEINQRSPRLLPNLTLGYDIYDTCGDVSLAITAALQLLTNQSDPQKCLIPTSTDSSSPQPETKVVIGERYSEVSIAVARIFALPSVTQISYASTSELLSKKYKFPTFLRTVSSDRFQTTAIYELVKYFSWQSVAIVGSDDEYGKYGTDSLKKLFGENNICVDFVEILPGDFSENSKTAGDLIEKIKVSTAEAIIMFTKDSNVRIVLEGVIKQKMNRTWIASDTWSTSPEISKIQGIESIGPVFGFIFKQNDVPGFEDYICSAFNGSTKAFLSHYQLSQINFEDDTECNCKIKTSSQSCLHYYIDRDESFNIYLAVQVIAEGLRRLLRCDNGSCEWTNFTAVQLFKEIRKVNISVDSTNIYFNKNGDPSLGYDMVFWNPSKSKGGDDIRKIGEYWPNEKITFHEDFSQWRKNDTVSVFNCSRRCKPGERLILKSEKCCFECIPCSSEEYSFGNGTTCTHCNETQYSPVNQRHTCVNKTVEFLEWTDPFAIILITIAVFAIVATVVIAIVIGINCGTPIVKAIGSCLTFVEVASLLLGFCTAFTFIGKPTPNSCVGIPLFGISFSLCISCILANLVQIMLGFSFEPRVSSKIKRLNQPVAVVVIIAGVQVAVSLAWLIVVPRSPVKVPKPTTILHQCSMSEDSSKFFAATIVYNSFWGFVCFIFAFKGRQLPDIYKNASLITVSMVMFLIIWIVFLPIFLTMDGKYKPAISSAAILISCLSILGCHLAPKCYIMLFRKEVNNQNAISEYIRKHYERKEISVISS
ncbi:LOW QUALITY PROTEIN: G-protein coupled receptor family C group 6 member A-like [Fundulus heteroclitus]|uniref:LOW QUALITY PROTEIN: G-protein coupled receptor family C group 6 member A-like n=1 Tax=Fundulus heteroclitus TaxID=8078 RepID=UPI00165A585A|nr:LOW QUALITY PROTEIN: G-protein coupled receptor family C group 6 member A-like [Fundulus heteroclitus]